MLKPGNVVLKRTHRLERRLCSPAVGLVTLGRLPEYDRHAPAVEQYVMKADDQLPDVMAHTNRNHPNQRRDRQIEVTTPVRLQEKPEALPPLLERKRRPIL